MTIQYRDLRLGERKHHAPTIDLSAAGSFKSHDPAQADPPLTQREDLLCVRSRLNERVKGRRQRCSS